MFLSLASVRVEIIKEVESMIMDISYSKINITLDFDGLPIHITDTAGIRQSEDIVEQKGIEKAKKAIQEADHVLALVDVQNPNDFDVLLAEGINKLDNNITVVFTKQDIHPSFSVNSDFPLPSIVISAQNKSGIDELKDYVKSLAGYRTEDSNVYSARERHLEAIRTAREAVEQAKKCLLGKQEGELVAFELLVAQNALNSITGEFNADDLLGEIFSSFCIGK